jgi:small subunit ribosomal protein S20
MAHHKSAIKRIRQSRRRRLYNRRNKRAMKQAIREVHDAKNYEEAMEKLSKANSVLDKISARKIIHKNNAANKKSQLAKYVMTLKEKQA